MEKQKEEVKKINWEEEIDQWWAIETKKLGIN